MQNWIVPAAIAAFFILRVVVKVISQSKSSLGGQRNQTGAENPRNVIHGSGTNSSSPPPFSPAEKQQQRKPPPFPPQNQTLEQILEQFGLKSPESQPVAEARTMEVAVDESVVETENERGKNSHFSEEKVTEEFEQTHSKGQSLEHHFHQYNKVDEFSYRDRRSGGTQLAPESKMHRQPSRIAALLGTRGDFRRAILLKEIMERHPDAD